VIDLDSLFRHGRALSRPSTSVLLATDKDVDARHKAGHDELKYDRALPHLTPNAF
jgi:hypothetical protein